MNKKECKVVLILCILICLISACSVRTVVNSIVNRFYGFVINQSDKEEQEVEEESANEEIVRGKDTMLIWGNMYVIGHYPESDQLGVITNELSDVILEKINKYKIKKKKLYIISDEGYAIIDEKNICRVYITIPTEEFVEEYSKDLQGNPLYRSRYIKDIHIEYLSDFNDYSDEERKMFSKLKK